MPFYGPERLSSHSYTARFRGALTPALFAEAGVGLMSGHFGDLEYINVLNGYVSPKTSFGGIALEAFVSHRFTTHFGMKAGITCDFNVETNNCQPVVLGTLGF